MLVLCKDLNNISTLPISSNISLTDTFQWSVDIFTLILFRLHRGQPEEISYVF